MNRIVGLYGPLGPQSIIAQDTKEVIDTKRILEKVIMNEFNVRGLSSGNYTATLTVQKYGVPEDERIAESLLWYCKVATDYLYN